MAFKLSVVKNCPVTRASQAKLIIPPDLLGEFAGTLQAERGQEWLVLLKGYRSEDGMEVRVTGVEVPTDQRRRPAHVEIDEQPIASWERGTAHLVERVVGVLHSHNEMLPNFSGTDYATLNDRFEVSIVISSQTPDEESTWLGFSYNAEGRVKLPCGAMGVVRFVVVPEGVRDWFQEIEPEFDANAMDDNFGDCAKLVQLESAKVQVQYYQRVQPQCGMVREKSELVKGVFGAGQQQIKGLLPPPVEISWDNGWISWRKEKKGLLEPAGATAEVEGTQLECEFCRSIVSYLHLTKENDLLCEECYKDELLWEGYGKAIDEREGLLLDGDSAWQERLNQIYEERGCV